MYSQFNQKIPQYWQKSRLWVLDFWSEMKTKDWTRRELVAVFFLACVLGMAAKTMAIKTVTIGYQDYLITESAQEVYKPVSSEAKRGPVCEE